MRRFSQRNSFVTLSEINITPLLDLAFVLLIIFVITHPMIEQSMRLKLPSTGKQKPAHPDVKNIRTVEISQTGEMRLHGRKMTPAQIEASLVQEFKSNPDLVVRVRCDKRAPFDYPYQAVEMCRRHGITQIDIQGQPRE
jgi:biopolymer transport protein ExbD